MVIFLLLYLNFGGLTETLIVMLSLPFSLVGGSWLLWHLGLNLSVAVAVGFIALSRRRGRNRRRHADLSRCGFDGAARTGLTRSPRLHPCRPQRHHHARRRQPCALQDDDRRRHYGKPVTDPVVNGHRLGSHAAYRRANDRRHGVFDHPQSGCYSCQLRIDQGSVRAKAANSYFDGFASAFGALVAGSTTVRQFNGSAMLGAGGPNK